MKMENKSHITVVVGAQWGDEGKGKVTSSLDYKVGTRWNGGSNAGANVLINGMNIILHTIPAAALDQNKIAYIGSGCVVNPIKINTELAEIIQAGFKNPENLSISPYATLVLPSHTLLDGIMGKKVGTTGNGIGPAYASIAQRQHGDLQKHLTLAEYLQNPQKGKEIVRANLDDLLKKGRKELGFGPTRVSVDMLTDEFDENTRALEPYLQQDPNFINTLYAQGHKFLLQGANSIALDGVTGPSPFVTSSRTLSAAAPLGSDMAAYNIDVIIGVAKVIMSRVGNGPFPSEFGKEMSENYCAEEGGYRFVGENEKCLYDPNELLGKEFDLENLCNDPASMNLGIGLRMLGGEYGATTKRPRRIGALDLVQLKKAAIQNRMDYVFLTKVDLLGQFADSSLPGIPVVTSYELDGKTIDYVPVTVEGQRRVKANIEYIPHITQDLTQIRDADKLSAEVKNLVSYVEDKVGVPVYGIGVGPGDDEKVILRKI